SPIGRGRHASACRVRGYGLSRELNPLTPTLSPTRAGERSERPARAPLKWPRRTLVSLGGAAGRGSPLPSRLSLVSSASPFLKYTEAGNGASAGPRPLC